MCLLMEAVYWYNVTPKDNVSLMTASANQIHRYHVVLKDINELPPDKPKQQQIRFDVGDRVWMKTPNRCCTSPYTHGHVTVVISPQNVLVDGMPHHIRDLHPVIGLDTSESGSDSEFLTQSARMITINEVRGDPLEVNTMYATDNISADESSEEKMPLPRRSTKGKRPAPGCHLFDHEITVGGVKLKAEPADCCLQ